MRVGENPMRQKKALNGYKRHRIIMPIYIPETGGYYADALTIFRLSIHSLLATVDPRHVSITIINNASVPEVDDDLNEHFRRGVIDRYIRHSENRGKPDPVAAELRASYEDFITLTDADVLFEPGWLQEVERVFAAFPEAGCVSPSPTPNLRYHFGSSNWLGIVPSSTTRLDQLVNETDLDMFEASLGGTKVFSEHDKLLQYAVERNGVTALLGAGHFVCTLRRQLFDNFSYRPQLGGVSAGERLIDEHVDREGYGRLSTVKAYVRHMGNTYEPWMQERALAPAGSATLEAHSVSRPRRRLLTRLPYLPRRVLAMLLYRWAEWKLRARTNQATPLTNIS